MDRFEHIKALRAQDYGVAALSPDDVDWLIGEAARVAELERGQHWLNDLPFFREQIANAAVQTPYGEGLPAPWTFLSMACDCVDALANRVAELEAQVAVMNENADVRLCALRTMINGFGFVGLCVYLGRLAAQQQAAVVMRDDNECPTCKRY